MRVLALLLLAACAAPLRPALADDAQIERASVERRIASVQTLIETSSAAREVDKSGRSDAIARRNEARQSARLARAAFDSGDLRAASSLADEAARQLMASVRLSRDETLEADETRREVEGRMRSARALLAAMRRIGAEKRSADVPQLAARVERLLGEAQGALDGARPQGARDPAEQAYLLAKASVMAMRGGDTLVRSLSFASKEEEYLYELDRNDTHQMLLRLALSRRGEDPFAISQPLEHARQARAQAQALAARGEPAGAIRLLEESTRELVRAIRVAGIYVPG